MRFILRASADFRFKRPVFLPNSVYTKCTYVFKESTSRFTQTLGVTLLFGHGKRGSHFTFPAA